MSHDPDGARGGGLLDWGFAGQPAEGSAESGDAHLVEAFAGGVLVMVVDGLGHGDRAAEVAQKTVDALRGNAHESVVSLMERCHRALAGTRGAVLSLASFDAAASTMTWLGVGNVEGVLLRAGVPTHDTPPASAREAQGRARESLLLRGGIVGYHMPRLRPVTLHVRPGDTLVLATDGLRSAFVGDLTRDAPDGADPSTPQSLADSLLASHLRGTDDALVLVARYRGQRGERA